MTTKFALTRTFVDEDDKHEVTKVLGIFPTPTDAQTYANGLIQEVRDMMDWEDEAPKWTWNEVAEQWQTSDFPEEMGARHKYAIDLVQV